MFSDPLGIVVGILMILAGIMSVVLCVLAFAGAPGLFMRDAAKNRTPRALFGGGLCAVIALGVLGAFFGFICAIVLDVSRHFDHEFNPAYGAIIGAVVFMAIEAVIAACMAGSVAESIRRQKQLAPDVAAYVLANFERLSAGTKYPGHITLDTLKNVSESGMSDVLLEQLKTYIADVGHEVDSYTTTSTTIISTGTMTYPVISTVRHSIYGASVEDVQSYPARVAEMFAKW